MDVQEALDLGVPVTGIAAAVFARALSSRRELRGGRAGAGRAAGRLEAAGPASSTTSATRSTPPRSAPTPRASTCSRRRRRYGWTQLRRARLDLARRLHHPGALPRRHHATPTRPTRASNLLLAAPSRARSRRARTPGGGWCRRGRRWASRPGAHVGAGLLRQLPARALPANLIQAQRDFFGAHTYQRIDRPGTFHTLWAEDGQEVEA